MSTRRRLSPEESRATALDAARAILVEEGPQAVTLKAVAARMNRTHANLLHHFGSAAELQAALAAHLAQAICGTIEGAVLKARAGEGSARTIVDMIFDAFDREGGGKLASWMALSGNRNALDPIVDAIHALVEHLDRTTGTTRRELTLTLVLLALGDAQMGAALAPSLKLPRDAARDIAERLLVEALAVGAPDSGGAPQASTSAAASHAGALARSISSTRR